MKRLSIGLIFVAAVSLTAVAEVQLVLSDGRVLDGVAVIKEDGQYLLELDGHEIMSIPAELVSEVRQSAEEEEEPKPKRKPGFQKAEPETLAGSEPVEDAPSGIRRDAEPEVLAGENVRPTRPDEAQAVFGEPARFQKGLSDPYWRPKSVFNEENDVTNFAPSTWADGTSDPTWTPDSAFDENTNVMANSESSWQNSVVDNSWKPKDGFKKTGTSFQPGTLVAGNRAAGSATRMATTGGAPSTGGRRFLASASTSAPVASSGDRSKLDVSQPALVAGGGASTAKECTWCPDLQASRVATAAPVAPRPAATTPAGTRAPATVSGTSTTGTTSTASTASSTGAARTTGASDAEPDTLEARACARSIFRPTVEAAGRDDIWHLRTHPWEDPAAGNLPLDFHVSSLTIEERVYSVTFTTADGGCRRIRATESLVSPGEAASGGRRATPADAYNDAVRSNRPTLSSDSQKIDYAAAAVALLGESTDAGLPERREVVETEGRLDEILAAAGTGCPVPSKKERKQRSKASAGFTAPSIAGGYGGSRITLVTWSPDGGRLETHDVEVADDGRVSIRSRDLAQCVGEHSHEAPADPPGSEVAAN